MNLLSHVKSDSIESAEALIRWFHPVNGMVSPGKFIPVFERNGFIVKTDRFVWESVCQFINQHREETGRVIPISVNVSRLNFYNLDLLEFLLGLLEKYDLESWMLKLELTESAYTEISREFNLGKESPFAAHVDAVFPAVKRLPPRRQMLQQIHLIDIE